MAIQFHRLVAVSTWRRIAKWAVVAAIVLVATAVILIQTEPVQQFLLRRAEDFARGAGVPFTAKHLRLKVFDLELSMSGFVYDNRGVRAEIDNFTVDFPWNIYRADGLVMNSLTADGLRVRISSPEPVLPEPSGTTTRLPQIVAERLAIRNGSFSYANESTRLEIPSFAIDAANGKGTLKLGAPVTITPETSIQIPEVPLLLSPESLRFGPTLWSIEYGGRNGSGLADGTFQWSPSIGARVNFATDRLAIEKWDGLIARGRVNYEDGVLNLEDFRATRGKGELTGSARISDQTKSARMLWKDVGLEPSGIRGETSGQLDMHWNASDFADIAGSGRLTVNTREYGRAESDVRIAQGRAHLNVRAASMGADIRAGIDTGLDRRLSGSFRMTHREYGLITADGRLAGTVTSPSLDARVAADGVMYKGIGPLDGSAQTSYRQDVLDISGLRAQLKRSTIPDGSLRINLKTRTLDGIIPAIIAELGDFVEHGAGQIQSSARISGLIDRPLATLDASSGGLDIEGTHIDNVEANAALDGKVLELMRLVARQNQGTLEASGTVNLDTEQTQGMVHVSDLQITEVRNFSGTVNLDADVSGSYRAPSASLKGEVAGINYDGQDHGSVSLAGTAGIDALNIRLESSKYNADIDGVLGLKAPYSFNAAVVTHQSEIQQEPFKFVANGRAEAAGALQPLAIDSLQLEGFTLTGEGIDLKADGSLVEGVKVAIAANLAELPTETENVHFGGQARADAVIRGTADNLQVEGEAHTTNASVQAMQMMEAANVEAAVDFTRDRFTIRDMHADYADARVTIGGSGTLKGVGEFTFDAQNIRPERLLSDRPLSGVVGVTGRVKVNAPQLDGLEGEAIVTQLELNARGVEIQQVQKGEITLANHIASIRNFSLEGPETRASATGTVNLETGDLNLDLLADTDLRIVEGFIPQSSAYGRIESQLAVRGTTAQPDMRGFVNLTDAQIQTVEPPLLLSKVNARVQLSGDRAQIEQASADVNGGAVQLMGETGFSSEGLKNAAIQASLMGTQLEYPKGLQSEIAANLALNGSSPALTISGNVNILDALYREDINLREEVFQRLTPEDMASTAAAPGLTDQINLDVTVNTTGPVTVANNLAKADLTGTFRIRGTVGDPVVLGRASTLEGGEVYFGAVEGAEAAAVGERRDRYIIERGTVDFNNPLRTEPTFDIEATHDLQVKDERYTVRLRATGTPTDLRTELTSDPYLSEPDIIAMLLTGRTFADLQGASVAVAREQLLDYVSGQLTSQLFQGAGAALGLDTVTIEPATIAAEEDISARLTVGKDISRYLSLVYSQNLAGPRNQSWILNYTTLKDFVVRGINRPDQDEIRLELRHGVEFGGGPPLPRRVVPRSEVKLNAINFDGSNFPIKDLMKRVAKPGKPYSISRMNDDVRSLHQFFASKGYADARIRTQREVSEGLVDANFTIEQGPKISFVYRGFKVPDDVQKEVLQIWVDGRAEASSLRASIEFLLRHLRDEGYLQARVSAENEAQNPDERLYAFQIDPGLKFNQPKWVFQGIEPLDITESAGVVMQDPEAIRDKIQYQLRGNGFLDAKSTVPELVIENGESHFVASVERGQQYLVSSVTHTGNAFFTGDHLTTVVILGPTRVLPADEAGAARPPEVEKPLKPFPYTSEWVSIARRRIMTEYWQQGFNDVQIGASTNYVPGSGRIEVGFDIKEGERQEIADIRIMGDEKTLRSHVLRYFKFSKGDPVDYTRINLTRKQLYDTGLFKRVDFEVLSEPQGYVTELHLNERAPWSVRYGFTVTDHKEQRAHDRDIGFSTELTYRNLLGTGITTGAVARADTSLREARLFGSFPVFLNRDVASTVSLFRTRETVPDVVSNTWGFTLQQQWRLKNFYLLSYDYAYRRVNTFERDLTDDDPDIVNGIVPVARFNATLSRDTRDDILNATRGTFFSNSFDFAPPGVGSSIQYIKNYTQYLRFREVRPNLIWASAYRVGMARGLAGNKLVPTDQFTAGGSTSLRAFGQDNAALQPGNALLITNQELRYPLFWRLGVVGFFDIGNVYERLGTARIFQQRYSPGFGLRINTPFILLRVDMGFNLWPRTGEDRKKISIGIGQAF